MSAAIDLQLFDIDSAAPSKRVPVGVLHLEYDTLTVRELIQQRIKQEVQNYNNNVQQVTQLLIKPLDIEQQLNKKKRKIDPETQIKKALQAFQQNGFFILVDEQQVESLEQTIIIMPDTEVSFFRLVPLVGG